MNADSLIFTNIPLWFGVRDIDSGRGLGERWGRRHMGILCIRHWIFYECKTAIKSLLKKQTSKKFMERCMLDQVIIRKPVLHQSSQLSKSHHHSPGYRSQKPELGILEISLTLLPTFIHSHRKHTLIFFPLLLPPFQAKPPLSFSRTKSNRSFIFYSCQISICSSHNSQSNLLET